MGRGVRGSARVSRPQWPAEWLPCRGPRAPEGPLGGDADPHERPCSAGGSRAAIWPARPGAGRRGPADAEPRAAGPERRRHGREGGPGPGAAPAARAGTGAGAGGVAGSRSRGPRRHCPGHRSVPRPPPARAPGRRDGGAKDLLEDAVACPHSSPLREAELLSVSLCLSSSSPLPLPFSFPSSPPLSSSPAPSFPSPHPLRLFRGEPYPARPCPPPALRTGCPPAPRSLAEAPRARVKALRQTAEGCWGSIRLTLWFSPRRLGQSHLEGCAHRCRPPGSPSLTSGVDPDHLQSNQFPGGAAA